MGKPGARKNDQIVSVTPGDVHIIMVPSPGGPVPTPIPHPCASTINGKLAKKVKVMGQPGAVKGSTSKHTPPHIPMGPGPFQKPPKNAGKIVTASSNVFYEGKEAAMLGDTGEMCSDPSDTPVGKVVGTAAMVLVGGGGQGSDEARAKASAKAMAAASAHCARFKDSTHSGHPINVATGDLVVTGSDFDLDGPLPVQFVRTYMSSRADTGGSLGWGWTSNLQESIEIVARGHRDWKRIHAAFGDMGNTAPDARYLVYSDPNGVTTAYHAIDDSGEIVDGSRERTIRRRGDVFELIQKPRLVSRFRHVAGPASTHQLVEVEDRNGNRNEYHYDTLGRPLSIRDCYRRQLHLEYHEDHLISISVRTSPHDSARVWCRYRYDEAGDLVEVVDRAGHSSHYVYDTHRIVEDRNPDGYSFYFEYDREDRCIGTWGQDGYLTRNFHYDPASGRTHEINGEGEHTVYHHTDAGIVWKTEKGEDFVVELGFDESGRWIGRSSGNTPVFEVGYNDSNDIAVMTDGEDATHVIEYNEFGQATRMVDPLGAETLLSYDDRGNVVERRDASGTTRYERDGRGREIRRILPNGRTIETVYDDFGYIRERRSGGRVAFLEHDALGHLVRSRTPEAVDTSIEWTPEGYPARVSKDGSLIAEFEYTSSGDVRKELDPHGRRVVREFGAPGVVLRERVYGESAAGDDHPIYEKIFHRDSEGRPLRIELGNRARSFQYDGAGRISREESSEGEIEEYRYDDSGLLCETIERAGSRFVEYNKRAQVLRVQDPDGAETSFEYDGVGRLISAENVVASVTIEHDERGRVVSESIDGDALKRDIDDETGRSIWSDGRGGRWVTSADSFGNAKQLQLAGARISFEYDGAGRVLRKRYGSGLIEYLEYDSFDRVTRSELRAGPVTLQTRSTRIEGGRIRSIQDSLIGDRQYEYDDRGRLVRVSGASEEYYAWSAGNELIDCHRYRAPDTSDVGGGLTRPSYEFDELGRVVRIDRGAGDVFELHYDARNQLVSVSLPDGGSVRYTYDPFGRRLEKRFSGGSRDGRRVRFCWRGEDMVRETHYQGEDLEFERRIAYLGHVPSACVESSGSGERTLYLHTDHRGAVILVSDERGEIVWRTRADSFGWTGEPETAPVPIGLPGQYMDEETGLAYNRHRHYDFSTNRYLEPDPIRGGMEDSPYSYPLDPIGEIDRLGLMATLVITMDPFDPTNIRDEQILASNHNARIVSWGALHENDLKGVDHVVINAHGNPHVVGARDSAGNQERVSGKALAERLKQKGFKGKKVTVVACQTGQSGGTFAQGAADELGPGSEVTAWPESVKLSEDGDLWMVTGKQPDGSLAFELADSHARIFSARAGDPAFS